MILALYGAGAMGRELKFIAEAQGGFERIVFIDDIKTGCLLGCPIYSFQEFTDHFSRDETRFVTSVGEPRFRRESFEKMKRAGYTGGVLRHPSAYISEDAAIGEDAAFCFGVFVGSLARIGQNFHASVRCVIGHDAVIGDHVRLGAGSFIGGHTIIGDGAFIGSGSMLKDRIRFGCDSVAAIGSAIFTDVPDHATVIGNPARVADDNRQGLLYHPETVVLQATDGAAPLSADAIAEKLWEVFSKVFAGIDFNPVSFRFRDSGWDSVTHMGLVAAMEEAFGVSLKGREVLKVNSYRACLDMVKKKLAEKGQ